MNEMEYAPGDKVRLIIGRPTNLGIEVYVGEEQRDGLLYHNEIFQPLALGQEIDAYIKKVRDDGKLDLSLQPQGFQHVIERNSQIILAKLKQYKGHLKLNDKSAPDEVREKLNMSKKAFKNAVGYLYKLKKIRIEEDGIYAVK